MRWLVDFYQEKRGIVARYSVDAPLPGVAVLGGRKALREEYPVARERGRRSLLERAERAGGGDGSGWVLYRLVRDDKRGSPGAGPSDMP